MQTLYAHLFSNRIDVFPASTYITIIKKSLIKYLFDIPNFRMSRSIISQPNNLDICNKIRIYPITNHFQYG